MFNFKAAMTSGQTYVQKWLKDSLDGEDSSTGIRVTTKSAIGYPPVWYAINKIGGHIGVMPLVCRKRLEEGSEPAKRHPAYRLLKTRPNKNQSAICFKETLMTHALLMRSGRAAIIREEGRPVELVLMLPDRTVTVMHEGEKWHVTNVPVDDPLEDHVPEKQNRTYYKIRDEDVLHIPGLSFNGVDGLSLIDIARETFGLGLAGQKATARNFKNNARPGIILEAPAGMFGDEADAKEFLDNFNEAHSGLDETGKAGLIRDGMSVTTMPISAKDAEWLEQRKFERQDTALLFLLESILGDDESVSYNSLEHKNLAYLSNCLLRWLVRWEQECDEKLLTDRQKSRDSHFFKFNEKALLRADSKTQMITLTGYLKNRVMNPNEVRLKLDMIPYDGGDSYENPAITPGEGSVTEDIDHDGDSDRLDAAGLARRALSDRFAHLIEIEVKRVNRAAQERGNFTSWVESYYEEHALAMFGEVFESVGSDADMASEHCEFSKNELFDLTEQVTQDDLSAAVAELTQNWPERAGKLADAIIEKELNYETV